MKSISINGIVLNPSQVSMFRTMLLQLFGSCCEELAEKAADDGKKLRAYRNSVLRLFQFMDGELDDGPRTLNSIPGDAPVMDLLVDGQTVGMAICVTAGVAICAAVFIPPSETHRELMCISQLHRE